MTTELTVGLAFYLLAAITLGSAVAVVMVRNLFRAALFLVLSFLGVAGLYVLLQADFVFAFQVLVYVGAVATLVIFAVMLTRNTTTANASNQQTISAFIVAVLLAGVMVTLLTTASWPVSSQAPPETTVGAIGNALFNKFVLPFELASVLLTAALVGAIIVARED